MVYAARPRVPGTPLTMSLSTTLILITLIVPQDAERFERQETPGAQTEALQRVA